MALSKLFLHFLSPSQYWAIWPMGSDKALKVVLIHQKKVLKKSTFWYFLYKKNTKIYFGSFDETGSGNQKLLVPIDKVCFTLCPNQIS